MSEPVKGRGGRVKSGMWWGKRVKRDIGINGRVKREIVEVKEWNIGWGGRVNG